MEQTKKNLKAKTRNIVVIVCGVAGSGKSVLCEKIAAHFGLKYVPTSGVLRKLIEKELEKKNIDVSKNTGFWESQEGKRFMAERAANPKFDKQLDKELLKTIEKGKVVLDSWTMPWLSKKGFKIWLTASDSVRFARIALRNGKSIEEIAASARAKEENSAIIYKKLYGFDWGKDLSVFDLVIDTNKLTEQGVFEKAKNIIEQAFCQRVEQIKSFR